MAGFGFGSPKANQDALDFTGVLDGYAPADKGHYDQSEADRELAKRLQDAYDYGVASATPYKRAWVLYRHFLKGNYIALHKTTGDLVRLAPEEAKTLRSVNNQLRPVARSVVGKLCRGIPTAEVSAPSNDFEDIHSAIVGTALLKFFRRHLNLDVVYQEAMEFLPWAGNAVWQVYWDRDAGQKMAACPVCDFTGEPKMEGVECPRCEMQRQQELQLQQAQHEQQMEMGMMEVAAQLPLGVVPDPSMIPAELQEPPPLQQQGPLPVEEEVPILELVMNGDVAATTRDIRDFFAEPGATCLDEANWVCYAPALPVPTVRRMFPEMAHLIDEDLAVYQSRFDALNQYSLDSFADFEQLRDFTRLYEFHERPTWAYPNGRIIWMCNGQILREIESPYWELFGRYPFFHVGWDRNQGEFWYEPWIQNAWHRQRELNSNETATREHVELLSKPKILNPKGSRLKAEEITAETAQVLDYVPAGNRGPEALKWPSLPSEVFNRGDQLKASIREHAGVSEQEMGISQSDPNARAAAILNAEADQQMGPITRRVNLEWKCLHKALLSLAQAFYTNDRTWSVAGPDGTEVYHFSEMNLNPGWDVELEELDGLSSNREMRQQRAMELWNMGYYTDPATGMPDKKMFARHAGLNDPSKGYDVEATERATAAAIPMKLARGELVEPKMYDDPKIFGEELLGWLRGPGRRQDPQIVSQVEQVWQFYVQWAIANEQGLGMEAMAPWPLQQQGGAGAAGGNMSAPGGTPNGSGIGAQADSMVSQADKQGEMAARAMSNPREG